MDDLAEKFLKYDYAEAKDLCKQFLTIVITVLVFSATFAEKIISFNSASNISKLLLMASWASMTVSIINCGIGLAYITIMAGRVVYNQRSDFEHIASVALVWIASAGILFIIGLVLMIVAAAVS